MRFCRRVFRAGACRSSLLGVVSALAAAVIEGRRGGAPAEGRLQPPRGHVGQQVSPAADEQRFAQRPEGGPLPYPGVLAPGHDPSAVQRTSSGHLVSLVTASGAGEAFGLRYIDPAAPESGWQQGPNSFLVPAWLGPLGFECGPRGVCPFWAPDLPSNGNGGVEGGDRFIMYFSVPKLPETAGDGALHCIGRSHGNWTVGPSGPAVVWADAGRPVVCTRGAEYARGGPRAIDPSVAADSHGGLWLTFGSWSVGGIVAVPLDPATGFLARGVCNGGEPFCWSDSPASFHPIANKPCRTIADCDPKYLGTFAAEASYLYHRRDVAKAGSGRTDARAVASADAGTVKTDVFLFVNWFWCCRGTASTYEIRVGRSASVTGPFIDRDGVDMRDGGGTVVLPNVTAHRGRSFVGPGHAGIAMLGVQHAFSFDYQAIDSDSSVFRPQLRVLQWDAEGWPVVTDANFFPGGEFRVGVTMAPVNHSRQE